MFKRWKEVWPLIKSAASAWIEDYAPSMGAALSYYTVFSLAPLLLLVISITGLMFGAVSARGALFGQLQGLMGAEASKAIEGLLAGVSRKSTGAVGTAVGVVVLVVGATTVFGELQGQRRGRLHADDRGVRDDLQDHAQGEGGLAREARVPMPRSAEAAAIPPATAPAAIADPRASPNGRAAAAWRIGLALAAGARCGRGAIRPSTACGFR